MNSKVLVIGGANTDILGFTNTLLEKDSNIGSVKIQSGGVGRNIAENLKLLGVDVAMISVFGDDMLSETLKFGLIRKGIDVSKSITISNGSPCIYMAVIGPDGDMKIAVNDMGLMEKLDRALLERYAGWINGFDMILPDANLSKETLEFIQSTFNKPMIFDPVSKAKTEKLSSCITGFGTLKMNRYEAECLTGMKDEGDAVRKLIDMGVQHAYVTTGEKGSYYADDGGAFGFAEAINTTVVNATGAGDAYTAGVAFGQLMEMSTDECAYFASACSSIAVKDEGAVNPAMSLTAVHEILGGINV